MTENDRREFIFQIKMSHEVRIDRVPTAATQASPSPLLHPSHLGLPPLGMILFNKCQFLVTSMKSQKI